MLNITETNTRRAISCSWCGRKLRYSNRFRAQKNKEDNEKEALQTQERGKAKEALSSLK